MIYCTKCGAAIQDAHQYCWSCGTPAVSSVRAPAKTNAKLPNVPIQSEPRAGSRKFSQLFGLDPRIAFLTLIVDMMLNAGDIVSMGILFPVSLLAGIVLGFIVYKAQINWYGDDKDSAKIKALIVGLLTAIPTPLPELLYIPPGSSGCFTASARSCCTVERLVRCLTHRPSLPGQRPRESRRSQPAVSSSHQWRRTAPPSLPDRSLFGIYRVHVFVLVFVLRFENQNRVHQELSVT